MVIVNTAADEGFVLLRGVAVEEIAAGLGLFTANADPADPWFTAFDLVEDLAWRPRRVRDALRALGVGRVEVKTRGGAADAGRAQRELSTPDGAPATVFVVRIGRQVRAWICRRRG